MPGVKDGWINERINTTDWLEGIGEMMYGSTWAETSLMLTYIQIPGLYVVPDKSEFACFDNLEVVLKSETEKQLILEVFNPTEMDAELKIWKEKSEYQNKILPVNYLSKCSKINVVAGQTEEVIFNK
jgi:hypothetical protein